MPEMPTCPDNPNGEIADAVRNLGQKWAASADCPHIAPDVSAGWDLLLQEWREDETLPLIIRKGGGVRGAELTHMKGRKIIVADNSPAQWSCHLALTGVIPKIQDIREWLEQDQIPMSFAIKTAERNQITYSQTLGNWSVNQFGWKLCHKIPVGLKTRTPLEEIGIEQLRIAFFNLLRPSNHFLLPKAWGGLGEVQEFIDGTAGLDVELFIRRICETAFKLGYIVEDSRNGRQVDFGNKKLHEGHLRLLYPFILSPGVHVGQLIDEVAPGRPCSHKPMREIIQEMKGDSIG